MVIYEHDLDILDEEIELFYIDGEYYIALAEDDEDELEEEEAEEEARLREFYGEDEIVESHNAPSESTDDTNERPGMIETAKDICEAICNIFSEIKSWF